MNNGQCKKLRIYIAYALWKQKSLVKIRGTFEYKCIKLCLDYFSGLVQDCSNSIANALELLQSGAKPSISSFV